MTAPSAINMLTDLQDFYRVQYYGDPGLGKSTAIARAANNGPLIYIDAEKGLKPKALKQRGVDVGNIEVHRDIRWQALDELRIDLAERLASDPKSVYAVAWDTATKTQDHFLDPVVKESVRKSVRKGNADRTEFEIHLEDRGVVSAQIQKLWFHLHALDCHVIVGTHQRRDKDDNTGEVSIGPALGPSAQVGLAGYMDCIIHCRVTSFKDGGEDEFSGRTRPDGRFMAKDRYGLLPPNMINPWFDRVVAYLDETITKEEDPLQIQARKRRGMGTETTLKTEAAEAPESDGADREPSDA